MRRIAIIAASAILLAGTTAACGDDSKDDGKAGDPASPTQTTSESTASTESPTEAPTETESTESESNASAFCTAATAEGFDTGGFDEIKTWASGLRAETPPADLSTDEAAGLELLLGMVESAKTEAELTAAGKAFSGDEQKKVSAFLGYVTRECA